MRLIAAILALLVLSLSGVPCSDSVAAPVKDGDMQTLLVHTPDDRNHEHNGIDHCSPFCVCGCCATFSIMATPMLLPQRAVPQAGIEFARYPGCAPKSMPLDVWEPPKYA